MKCKTSNNNNNKNLTKLRHKYKKMEINVQIVQGGNSVSFLFCMLIGNLMELKCKLWRSVEKAVKILARYSFFIKNRADTWTETTYGNKCGCLLSCSEREQRLAMAATRSSPSGYLSTRPAPTGPEKHLDRVF